MASKCLFRLPSNIKLIICDMAGTTIQENGLVYNTLRKVMNDSGLNVSKKDMKPWYGAKKESVIEHFILNKSIEKKPDIKSISDNFDKLIEQEYSKKNSVTLIHPDLLLRMKQWKDADIKIGLDTGYPAHIQRGLIQQLQLNNIIDAYISSYDVHLGRPHPYMIYRIMEAVGVLRIQDVVKVGDSVRDIEMGRNAGCGLVIGVKSGADTPDTLFNAGADQVIDNITDLVA